MIATLPQSFSLLLENLRLKFKKPLVKCLNFQDSLILQDSKPLNSTFGQIKRLTLRFSVSNEKIIIVEAIATQNLTLSY